jgi:hypothetical protein
MRAIWTCGLMTLLLVAGLLGHSVQPVASQGCGFEECPPTATATLPSPVPTEQNNNAGNQNQNNGGNQGQEGGRHGQDGGRHGRDEARPDLARVVRVPVPVRRVIIDPFDILR